MSKKFLLLFPTLLLILFSCSKKITPNSPTSDSGLISSPASLTINNTDFLYFNSKSNFNFKDNEQNLSANAILRMKKDSVIWINVSPGLGVEAMRALMTKDSIVVVDKINKKFLVYDFNELTKKYNFNIDFALLQNVILGNQILPRTDADRLTKESNFIVLTQKSNQNIVESFINEKTSKVEKIIISETGTSNMINVAYSNFKENEDKKLIPHNISLDLDYSYLGKKYSVSIGIDHQKAEFSEKGLKFPFNIPAKYEKVE